MSYIKLSCCTFQKERIAICILSHVPTRTELHDKSTDFARVATHLDCQRRLSFSVAAKFNQLATSIRISLEPQGWLRLLLTIPQSGVPISVSFLLFSLGRKKKNYFCSAIAPRAGPAINQSGKLWHTAQLAALTWYITQAVAAACSTAKSSGGSRLVQRLCWLLALKATEVSNLFLSSLI